MGAHTRADTAGKGDHRPTEHRWVRPYGEVVKGALYRNTGR